MKSRWLILFFLLFVSVASASAPPTFKDDQEENRYRALTAELRCVMCQNQSLADSNAAIAIDLRQQVLVLMREGRSDDDIKTYLVGRYGEFILYAPRVNNHTYLLWFGPLLFVFIGAWVISRIVRRRAAMAIIASDDATPPAQENDW